MNNDKSQNMTENSKECTICFHKISALKSLTHYKCRNCMEKGIQNKLVCESCIKKWPDQCPFDRQKLDQNLDAIIIRTPLGTKLNVIIKQKQCCCLRIANCWKKNIELIQQLPECFTIYSWCQAILKVLLLFASVSLIGFVFNYGLCMNKQNSEFCWICILSGILNIFGAILLIILLLAIIKPKYKLITSILYGIFGSTSFLIAISVNDSCELEFYGLVLLIVGCPIWSCCGYNSDLTQCE